VFKPHKKQYSGFLSETPETSQMVNLVGESLVNCRASSWCWGRLEGVEVSCCEGLDGRELFRRLFESYKGVQIPKPNSFRSKSEDASPSGATLEPPADENSSYGSSPRVYFCHALGTTSSPPFLLICNSTLFGWIPKSSNCGCLQ
jgi:hypothetical protein